MVETVFPTRGGAGGWRDCWDDPDDHAQLRARAEAPFAPNSSTRSLSERRAMQPIPAEVLYRCVGLL
jgi:hypothetical protein